MRLSGGEGRVMGEGRVTVRGEGEVEWRGRESDGGG